MNPYYRTIAERANHRCEYCQAPEVVFNFPFEVEHIISLSRQGANDKVKFVVNLRQRHLQSFGNAWDILESLTGTVEAPTDWSAEHDHYLYGTANQESES